jgi:hypothetical protein
MRFTHGLPGSHGIQIKLNDAPVQFDDAYFLGYDVEASVEVCHWVEPADGINQTSFLVDQALAAASPLIAIDRNSSLPSTQSLLSYDALVVNGIRNPSAGELAQLTQFQKEGGTILVIPDSACTGMRSISQALGLGTPNGWIVTNGQVEQVWWTHPLFQGVFRSVPKGVDWPTYDRLLDRIPSPNEEVLATAGNGMPFLSLIRPLGQPGTVFLFHSPLETGNFTRHGLFVPTLLRMVESSRQTHSMQLTLGEDQTFVLPLRTDTLDVRATDLEWQIRPDGKEQHWVPEVRSTTLGTKLGWGNALTEPGLYRVMRNQSQVAVFGLNHERNESRLDCWLYDEWEEALRQQSWPAIDLWSQPAEGVAALVEQNIAGRRLAWYFVLAAIVALALETLFLRKWKSLFS